MFRMPNKLIGELFFFPCNLTIPSPLQKFSHIYWCSVILLVVVDQYSSAPLWTEWFDIIQGCYYRGPPIRWKGSDCYYTSINSPLSKSVSFHSKIAYIIFLSTFQRAADTPILDWEDWEHSDFLLY